MHIDNIVNSVLNVKASENLSIEDDLKSDSTKTIAELIDNKTDDKKEIIKEEENNSEK